MTRILLSIQFFRHLQYPVPGRGAGRFGAQLSLRAHGDQRAWSSGRQQQSTSMGWLRHDAGINSSPHFGMGCALPTSGARHELATSLGPRHRRALVGYTKMTHMYVYIHIYKLYIEHHTAVTFQKCAFQLYRCCLCFAGCRVMRPHTKAPGSG